MGQTVKGRDLAAESLFEYGSRVGFWRLMRLFEERDAADDGLRLRARLRAQSRGLGGDPEAGYDICSHGWRWIKHYELAEAEEREHIRKAIASTEKMIGQRPEGWYCRYGPGENTRRLVVEEGGFLYDSDYYGDELPFWLNVDGKAPAGRALLAHHQRRQVHGGHRQRRPVVHAAEGRLRHALSRGQDPAQHDVGRHAHAR